MASYLSTEVRRVIRLLREAFDVPFVVLTVADEALEKCHGGPVHGDCLNMGDHWRIRLGRGNSDSEMVDSLIHEVGHVIDEYENGPAPKNVHRRSFWLCHGRVDKAVKG